MNSLSKFVLHPRGSDVAKLLMLCAPQRVLKELDLSEATSADFEAELNGSDRRACQVFIQMLALALYYASKSPAKLKKSRDITKNLYLSPEVLCELTMIAQLEGDAARERSEKDLVSEANSRRVKKGRHNKPGSKHMIADAAREAIRKIWASGKYTDRDLCAREECDHLGASYSVVRRALNATPNPSPWPAKESQQSAKKNSKKLA
jgi:hypothetical protein